jgi:acyl carrier protein
VNTLVRVTRIQCVFPNLFITQTMCVLHMQVSPDEPLMAAGLDSLGSVELRNTLESSLAVPLPPTLAMDYPTAAAIAAYAASKMPAAADDDDDDEAASDSGSEVGMLQGSSGAPARYLGAAGTASPVLAVTALNTR